MLRNAVGSRSVGRAQVIKLVRYMAPLFNGFGPALSYAGAQMIGTHFVLPFPSLAPSLSLCCCLSPSDLREEATVFS